MAILSMFPGGGGVKIPLKPVVGFMVTAGIERVALTWQDPEDEITSPSGATAAKWQYTRIIRKEGSQPQSPNDGVLVLESSVRDQYKTEPYNDMTVTPEVHYYYAAYAYNTQGVASEGQFGDAIPRIDPPALEDCTWTQITDICAQGKATEYFKEGDQKTFTFDGQTLTAEIVGFGIDELADGSGDKAGITFALKYLMDEAKRVHSSKELSSFFNYSQTERAVWYRDTVFPGLDPDMQANLVEVNKQCVDFHNSNAITDYPFKLWDFSQYELSKSSSINEGKRYPYFATSAQRVKTGTDGKNVPTEIYSGGGEPPPQVDNAWSTRSIGKALNSYGSSSTIYATFCVNPAGQLLNEYAGGGQFGYRANAVTLKAGVCFGFCVGRAPKTEEE